jgi:hypothetical protein
MKTTVAKASVLRTLKKELPYLQDKYGVKRVALYGSFAKGTQTGTSDVDILVQLEKPIGLEFVELASYLEKALGRKVDLTTADTLRRSLKSPRYKRIAANIRQTLSYV